MAITDEQILASPRYYSEEIERLVGRIRELEADGEALHKEARKSVLQMQIDFDKKVAELSVRVRELEAERETESKLAGEWELRYDESQRLLTEARNEIKRGHKDHQLTIDTFRQQEKIWKQKTAETVADFRSQVVSKCKEAAGDPRMSFNCSARLHALADEIEAMEN